MKILSFKRLKAVMMKEFIQMFRDPMAIGMMIGIPIIQLVLFGFAINTNPKHLPTAVVSADHSVMTRSLMRELEATDYFDVILPDGREAQTTQMMKEGRLQFVIHIPPNFTRKLVRGESPEILLEADATDPVATGSPISAAQVIKNLALQSDLGGPLSRLNVQPAPFSISVHAKYNPRMITQLNIIPGLIGVVLSLTLSMITALAMTRERERGTMEMLLSTPVTRLEVMIGKIFPYVLIGYGQLLVILPMSYFLMHVPIQGSLVLLFVLAFPFIVAHLAVGLTASTAAENQMQAMLGATNFFLPSILLSGFMFPFRGMPDWAQYLGQIIPLTHMVVITRGIMLKGASFIELWPHIWPICLFAIVLITIGILRYRQTLD